MDKLSKNPWEVLTSYTVKAKTDIFYMIIGNRKAGLLDSEGLLPES
jgi:hypothetical protein